MSRVVAIIQARLGSSRLPGKVLLDLAGEPMLARVVERVQRAELIDDFVIATTNESRDDPLVELCGARGWAVHRGSENDVLDRYHGAAKASDADVVVRITSDCPLLSADVLDRVVARFLKTPTLDYVSNTQDPRTFPRGLDVEVMSASALERAWTEDKDPAWREHVTPYIYRSGRFELASVVNDIDFSAQRWTVDTPEDYAFAKAVYDELPADFEWTDVLALLERRPDIQALNVNIPQKTVS